MRFTKRIQDLPTNRNGERQLEPHHLDDNFAAQDDALLTGFRALFAAGGVAVPGTVTLTGTNLRVQGRVGVTLDGAVPVHVEDQTLALASLAAGKGYVVMTTDPVTIQRPYTDVVTGESLTDTMNVSAGQLAVIGAGTQGATLDGDGYPVAPSNTVPVARVTRTGDGVTLDRVDNPQMTVRARVAGTPGVGVTGASISGGHLILHLSNSTDIDAGALPGGGGGSALPAGGTAGQVLTKASAANGDAAWQTPSQSGGAGATGGGTGGRPAQPTLYQLYYDTTVNKLLTCTSTAPVVWRDSMGTVSPNGAGGYTSYRLNITAGGDANYTQVSEFVLRAVAGGAQVATGGAAFDNGNIGGGYDASKAFDGDGTTSWTASQPATSGAPHILGYTLATPSALAEYAISIASATRGPISWTFEGSPDGNAWTVLDTQVNQHFSDGLSRTFVLS